MILSVFITVITDHDKPQPSGCLLGESLVQDKVKTTNQMHASLLEFGISVPRGSEVISRLSTILEDSSLPQYLSQLLLKLQQHCCAD